MDGILYDTTPLYNRLWHVLEDTKCTYWLNRILEEIDGSFPLVLCVVYKTFSFAEQRQYLLMSLVRCMIEDIIVWYTL